MILVESPGFQTSVQDLGRPGYGALGVSASGAADSVALRVANLLVGNRPGAPALEMTAVGGRYRLTEDAVVAVMPGGRSWRVRRGEVLDMGRGEAGFRIYLAVRGGIEAPLILGSASTHLMSGLGGRALRKGDQLCIGTTAGGFIERSIRPEVLSRLAPRKVFRVTRGPQADRFSEGGRARFAATAYRVTPQSDRMGIRLEGPPLQPLDGHHMLTEGVALGAIQIPAGGQPIILFVEQQTTGGYPKIANVIAADLASLGQVRPGETVRFEWTAMERARELFIEQEALLEPGVLFG